MITIAYISDAHYLSQTLASIRSLIFFTNPNRRYSIYLIITDAEFWRSPALAETVAGLSQPHVTVQTLFFDITGFGFKSNAHIAPSSYARLFLPSILPDSDKTIYLDGDTLVMADIAPLFDQDITHTAIAAAPCALTHTLVNRKWRIRKDYFTGTLDIYFSDYLAIDTRLHSRMFNAGVLLMNLAYMREHHHEYKLKEIHDNHQSNFIHLDQCVLSKFYLKSYQPLDVAWNFQPSIWVSIHHYQPPFFIDDINWQDLFGYMRAAPDIKIIHFAGGKKPWTHADEVMFSGIYHLFAMSELPSNAQQHIAAAMTAQTQINKPWLVVKAVLFRLIHYSWWWQLFLKKR